VPTGIKIKIGFGELVKMKIMIMIFQKLKKAAKTLDVLPNSRPKSVTSKRPVFSKTPQPSVKRLTAAGIR
jgi:hypothetical protein